MPHKSWDEIKFSAYMESHREQFEEMRQAFYDNDLEKVARIMYDEKEKRVKARAQAVQDLRVDL